MQLIKYLYLIPVMITTLIMPSPTSREEPPLYRVVLDPGHGGVCLNKKSYGDRYDTISGKYLMYFAEGASWKGLSEHVVVYQIADRAKKILDLCSPGGDFDRFREIVKKFSDDNPPRISIIASLSRGDSSNVDSIKKREDPNSEFRLYDFFDRKGTPRPGRISSINQKKPHLVVSLHLTTTQSEIYRGMSPVIVAPYSIMHDGLLHLQGKKGSDFFYRSPYRYWFQEDDRRSYFEWFLKDVTFYFMSYPLEKNRQLKLGDFKGYRYNMVSWAYKDPDGWEKEAGNHASGTAYANSFQGFNPKGAFWERERSKYEEFRRDGGEEGFGGDNYYATAELIRYILYSLHLNNLDHPHQRMTRPYISTWSVPLHVNAIAAFIELGLLNNARHRYILTSRQQEIAEGIAVGIYSLFAGITPKKQPFTYLPKGKKLNLDRYKVTDSKTYFDMVIQ